MTVVKVRRATPEDALGMMKVHLGCLTHSYPGFYSETLLEKWKSLLRLEHYVAKTSTGWCFVAVIARDGEEEVVGYGHLNTNEHNRIPKGHKCDVQVESLYVSVYHQKCGIGLKIMQEMERTALKENHSHIAHSLFDTGCALLCKIGLLHCRRASMV